MAKSKTRAEVRVAARQRVSSHDEEGLGRRLVIGAAVLVLLLVVGIIAFGWWWSEIRPFSKTVLQVGDTKFSLDHVVRRMELELSTNTPLYQSADPRTLSQNVIQRLEKEGKLLEGAAKLKIKVTDKEVDAKIRELGGLSTGASPSEFVAELERQVEESGLTQDEFLQKVRAELLEEKVRNYFIFTAPAKEDQAKVRWIALREESLANEVMERLEAGEDFGDLARELSFDSATAPEGGELGWRVRGQLFIDEVEEFVFEDGEVGERSGIIDTDFGFYIVEIEEKQKDREVDQTQRAALAERLMNEWLEGLNQTLTVKNNFTEADETKALQKVAG